MQTRKSSPSTAPTLGSPSAVSAYTPSASTSSVSVFSDRSAEEAKGTVTGSACAPGTAGASLRGQPAIGLVRNDLRGQPFEVVVGQVVVPQRLARIKAEGVLEVH